MTSRADRTRAHLQAVALDLFEERGYRGVTVDDIAAAAGVSHMTFFRYFATKESALLYDPFDPIIARAVAAQAPELPAIERVARGMLSLVPMLGDGIDDTTRRGIALVAAEPSLAGAMAANMAATEAAIVAEAAPVGGERAMRMAAAALLAAMGAALLEWSMAPDARTLGDLIAEAVTTIVPTMTAEVSR